MKLNFNILKQKLSNLNNIILPNTNSNYSNSNYILNKRYDTNNSNTIKNSENNNLINYRSFNYRLNDNLNSQEKNKSVQKRNILKKKFLNANYNKIIGDQYIKTNNFRNTTDNTNYNKDFIINGVKIKEKTQIENSIINKSIEINLDNLSKKLSDNSISDDELSNIADELINSISPKKEDLNNLNTKKDKTENNNIDNNNKIINKKTSINNNYIITNISGTVNYTPTSQKASNITNEEDINKNLNKNNFIIFKNNNFTINSDKKSNDIKSSIYHIEKINEKDNKNNIICQEIIIPGILETSLNNEKNVTNEDENNKNNEIQIPIDNADELNKNINIDRINKKPNIKNKDSSRNKKNNNIFKERKNCNSYKIDNTMKIKNIINKKKLELQKT